jgi:hypothetical protein
MLASFVQWAKAVRLAVGAQQFWCDAIDPLNGRPLVRHYCRLQCSTSHRMASLHDSIGNRSPRPHRWALTGIGNGARLPPPQSF